MTLKKIVKGLLPKKMQYKISLKKYLSRKCKYYSDIEKSVSDKYYERLGKRLNWENPTTYTEKLNVSKVYMDSAIKSNLTDKYKVRDWVEKVIGGEYLIPLLGVYDSFDEINFDDLPKSFVIKCNHDSGSVTIVKDKSVLNLKELKEKYSYYLKRNYALFGYEMHYNNIKPKIIIEKYLGEHANDYKFLCFGGKAYYCWIDFDRFANHTRNIYDLNWNPQPFKIGVKDFSNYSQKIEKPKEFSDMCNIVNKLCKDFDQVRVDLYLINGKIYFGEMTFTSASGFGKITPDEWDKKIGSLWSFDNCIRNEKVNKKVDWNVKQY